MRGSPIRWLRLGIPAVAVAAWLAVSFGQPGTPPPAPAESAPPPSAPPPAAGSEDGASRPVPSSEDEPDDVFIPTEELQPDAAVTFPVDI